MMNAEAIKAYDSLVPADQLVIDAMIVTLYKKDKQIRELVSEICKDLEETKPNS